MERGQLEPAQTRQRVDDMHFCLYQRALHPELFNIQRIARIERDRYQAEIWVVGLSHVITAQIGDQILTEVIADDLDLLPKAGLATSFRFRGERDHAQSFQHDVKYLLSTQVERLTPQLFPATYRDYIHYAENSDLFEIFPDWEHEGLAPFSFIDFDARDHELLIHSFHAFPEELTLLKTQSIFEVGQRKIAAW